MKLISDKNIEGDVLLLNGDLAYEKDQGNHFDNHLLGFKSSPSIKGWMVS